jgi:hypothetical protein
MLGVAMAQVYSLKEGLKEFVPDGKKRGTIQIIAAL